CRVVGDSKRASAADGGGTPLGLWLDRMHMPGTPWIERGRDYPRSTESGLVQLRLSSHFVTRRWRACAPRTSRRTPRSRFTQIRRNTPSNFAHEETSHEDDTPARSVSVPVWGVSADTRQESSGFPDSRRRPNP